MKSTGHAGPWKFGAMPDDKAVRLGVTGEHEALVDKIGTRWRWSTHASGGWARTRQFAMNEADIALKKAGVELTK